MPKEIQPAVHGSLRSLSSALVVFILNLQGASGTWAMQIGRLLSLAWGGSLLAPCILDDQNMLIPLRTGLDFMVLDQLPSCYIICDI